MLLFYSLNLVLLVEALNIIHCFVKSLLVLVLYNNTTTKRERGEKGRKEDLFFLLLCVSTVSGVSLSLVLLRVFLICARREVRSV